MFPKKYNFAKREEYWKKKWEKDGTYRFDEESEKPVFSVDTPPPYVSASHLHAGHIMSYSQAEFVVRFKRMRGYAVFYPMGFDDNGLPTERFVEKKYNVNKNTIARSEFVKLCLKETKVGAENYKNLWTNLGISVDWTKTYSTINKLCQKTSQWSFLDLLEKKVAYKAYKPILWCTHCQTAVAQADLEDKEETAKLVYIKAKLENGGTVTFATTRPELLHSCVGISVNPADKRYKSIQGKTVTLPISGAKIKITTDEIVDPKYGTGIVYFCSSGDQQFLDWETRHPIKNKVYLISENGKLNSKAGKYKNLSVKKAREMIIEDLKNVGALEKVEEIKHTVNVHERCGATIDYVNSSQWFVKILDIKKELLERGNELSWYPKYMKSRYEEWVRGLKWDWCISRQRYYGVPFPIWYCKKCGAVIKARKGDLPIDPTESRPPIKECPVCRSNEFIPEIDVMDTWATSSCTPFIIPQLLKNDSSKKKVFPNSLRPQAFEIIRTWLFYSLVKSHYHFDSTPFKNVMISGHGLDETGKKISKRLGNYVEPSKLLKEYGADAIRYWATGATLGSNHRFNLEEIKKGKYTVNKIFNASRFCNMYLETYTFKEAEIKALEPEDRWILHNLNKTIGTVTKRFENYEYSKARNALDEFFWNMFCDYYIEMVKHRGEEENAKYTLYTVLLNSLKLYAPIMPFITEEVFQLMFSKKGESIHTSEWPKRNTKWEETKDNLNEINVFIQEIDKLRKEKTKKGLRLKDEIKEYRPNPALNKRVFSKKLQEMFNIQKIV